MATTKNPLCRHQQLTKSRSTHSLNTAEQCSGKDQFMSLEMFIASEVILRTLKGFGLGSYISTIG